MARSKFERMITACAYRGGVKGKQAVSESPYKGVSHERYGGDTPEEIATCLNCTKGHCNGERTCVRERLKNKK